MNKVFRNAILVYSVLDYYPLQWILGRVTIKFVSK